MLKRIKSYLSIHPEAPLLVRFLAILTLVYLVAIVVLLVFFTSVILVSVLAEEQRLAVSILSVISFIGPAYISLLLLSFYGLAKLKKWGLYLNAIPAALTVLQGVMRLQQELAMGMASVTLGGLILGILLVYRKKFQY